MTGLIATMRQRDGTRPAIADMSVVSAIYVALASTLEGLDQQVMPTVR
jgi:hypothetical protein